MKAKRYITKTLFYLVTVVIGLIYVVPIWMVLVNSLKNDKESGLLKISLPNVFHFENYATVFTEGNIASAFLNGCIEAFGSVIIILFISSIASFVIARRKQKFTNSLYFIFLIGMVVPIAFIPTYLVLNVLHLLNTYLGLILVFSTYGIPISVFMYTGFLKTVPVTLDEAAIIDGCGPIRLFFTIIFPLLKPVTVSLFILHFVGAWNDATIPLFFSNSEKWALPLTIYNFYGSYQQSWNLIFADIIITIAPLLIIYIFCQKYIVAGMTAGAVKG